MAPPAISHSYPVVSHDHGAFDIGSNEQPMKHSNTLLTLVAALCTACSPDPEADGVAAARRFFDCHDELTWERRDVPFLEQHLPPLLDSLRNGQFGTSQSARFAHNRVLHASDDRYRACREEATKAYEEAKRQYATNEENVRKFEFAYKAGIEDERAFSELLEQREAQPRIVALKQQNDEINELIQELSNDEQEQARILAEEMKALRRECSNPTQVIRTIKKPERFGFRLLPGYPADIKAKLTLTDCNIQVGPEYGLPDWTLWFEFLTSIRFTGYSNTYKMYEVTITDVKGTRFLYFESESMAQELAEQLQDAVVVWESKCATIRTQ